MKMPYVDESQAFMQLDGYGVVGIDAGDHDVLMHGRCQVHEFDHQSSANALAAAVAADMNAVFHAVLIARRCAKFAESPKARDARCILGDYEGKAPGALRVEPGGTAFRSQLDLRVHGGRRADHLVINL